MTQRTLNYGNYGIFLIIYGNYGIFLIIYGNYGIFLIIYGNYGIFLIMGHAGFCPSTVGSRKFRSVARLQ